MSNFNSVESARDYLLGQPKGWILDLFGKLNGTGKAGFDHERTRKPACIDKLLGDYSLDSIQRAVSESPAPVYGAVEAIPAAAPVADGNPQAAALAALQQLLTPQVDESKIRQMVTVAVDDAVGKRVPRILEIRKPDAAPVQLAEHTHPVFDKVVKLANQGVNVMMVGPAGCGKTHLAHQVAKALGKTFGSISGSAGVSEAQLTGRLLPTGENGRFEYTESPFIREYKSGGVFLFDEVDAFDANCLLTVNSATANGGFEVESRAAAKLSTYVERHPESVLLASANTYGTGAGALYVGRAQLDAATLDRWYVVQMDYDKEWESTLAPAHVCAFVWKLRDAINSHKMRRVASTRMIQKAAKAVAAGIKWADVQADLLSGWTTEEKSKANV